MFISKKSSIFISSILVFDNNCNVNNVSSSTFNHLLGGLKLFKILKYERSNNINSLNGCLNFAEQVKISKDKLINKIKKIKSRNHKICGYGATSKSTTILNYCKINSKNIDCIFDTTKDKIGKFTPGTHIPIVDYKLFKNSEYKHVFLFAWNHKKEIMNKEKNNKKLKWFTHLK